MLCYSYQKSGITQYMTCKARLVCNGSQVDQKNLSTRATVVKSISVRLLDLIANALGLEVLCGDIGNAFIQATTNEKIYTKLGPEFGTELILWL